MTKKVTDILKELDIPFEELQSNAAKLDIEIKAKSSSISDADASRIISTISMLKGIPVKEDSGQAKPKLKAVPIINKVAPKAKPPVAKPIISKETEEKTEKTEAKAEKIEDKAEKTLDRKGKKAPKAEKTNDQVEKTAADLETLKEEKKEAVAKAGKAAQDKASEQPSDTKSKAEKIDEPKAESKEAKDVKKDAKEEADKEEKKEEAKEETYENAPGKPMRFKKIYDASKDPAPVKARKDKPKSEGRDRKGGKDRSSEKGSYTDKGEGGDRRDRKGTKKPDAAGERKNQQRGGARPSQDAKAGAPAEAQTGKTKAKSKRFFENKDKEREKAQGKRKLEKYDAGGAKNSRYFDEHSLEKQTRTKRKSKPKTVEPEIEIEEMLPEGAIAVTAPITVAGLSEQAEISASKIIMALMKLGVMANVNQSLDKDAIELLAEDLGLQIIVTVEEEEAFEPGLDLHDDTESELKPRAPIITVMGHVDHGKTSLLDAIRNTHVTAGESGGITQHIGAYEVMINDKKIVFLDTPGHEAFTTMRARGAQVTDIAVLVVAADDGVMPQTVESISHAKAAGVPIIVAINKMDKPGANPDRVKTELSEHGILTEDWGGNVISVPVSAKTGDGIEDLLEMILLQAEVLELRANPDRLALGTVIEARLDKAKGPIATLLVTNGTLKAGQSVVAGTCAGKIRVMTNYKGETIRKALPATPVEILGLSDVPMAGDAFNAVKDDKLAREIAAQRRERMREEVMAKNASMTLDKLFSQIQEGETKELNLIVKADVQGSVGAIISSLEKLDTPDVKVNVIHSGVGTVTESDVMLAETSNAIIIGFNVRPTSAVSSQAQDAEVEIRLYRVIYDILDDIQDAMKGMLDPEYEEEVLGLAVVRETFKVPGIGTIAGAYVTEGRVMRNAKIRLVRDGIVIHEGTISSLRRFKDDVKEVLTSYECGIGIENYNDIKPEDEMECFRMVEVKR